MTEIKKPRGQYREQGGSALGLGGICKCTNPECGYEEPHKPGEPCLFKKCPKCGGYLRRY